MKHILLAFGLMLAMCGDPANKPPAIGIKSGDTQYVRVHWARDAFELNAKLVLKDTMREVWEYNADSSERTGKQKRVWDSLWFVRIADSVLIDTISRRKRWIDTFIAVDKLYIMRIAYPAWKTDSQVIAERRRQPPVR
jgi:hypothetical protein